MKIGISPREEESEFQVEETLCLPIEWKYLDSEEERKEDEEGEDEDFFFFGKDSFVFDSDGLELSSVTLFSDSSWKAPDKSKDSPSWLVSL